MSLIIIFGVVAGMVCLTYIGYLIDKRIQRREKQ